MNVTNSYRLLWVGSATSGAFSSQMDGAWMVFLLFAAIICGISAVVAAVAALLEEASS